MYIKDFCKENLSRQQVKVLKKLYGDARYSYHRIVKPEFFLKKMFKLSPEVIILNTNKKERERQNRQKNLNEFNSITHKKEPENQNQTHNIRSEEKLRVLFSL